MKFVLVTAVIAICVLQTGLSAHYYPMIQEEPVQFPPLVEPGPDAALLKIHVRDAQNDETVGATICVNDGAQEPAENPFSKHSLRNSANRLKGPIRFRPIKPYFYADGNCNVSVPPGKAVVEARKGYEYIPARKILHLEPNDTVDVVLEMVDWAGMEKRGWYCGDTHIHMDRTGDNDEEILTLVSAKGIRYAYLLSMNTLGYAAGTKYESWLQSPGLGEKFEAEKNGYFISSGQEYRTSTLGHVTIIMTDEYVPGTGETENTDLGPSLAIIADQVHERGGYIGLAHGGYNHQEADGLLLADKIDFLELLQFGGYRSLGLDGWYDFLNIGYRLPIVGACDYPYTRELGSEVTYVWSDSRPDPRSFARALAEGHSFATSGPMIFLKVAGNRPGDIVSLPSGTDTTLTAEILVESPLFPVTQIELIVNGVVIAREYFAEPVEKFNLSYPLKISESMWVAARAYSGAGTDAHTNPIYIYVGNKLPFKKDSARNIISRLEGSIDAIPNSRITKRLEALADDLRSYMERGGGKLPFPSVPKLNSERIPRR